MKAADRTIIRGMQHRIEATRSTVSVLIFVAAVVLSPGKGKAGSTAWSFLPSPNSGAFTNSLAGVHGSSPQDIWAVGSSTDSLLDRLDTLAMHWDGTSWTIFPTPNPDPSLRNNRLYDVTTIAPDDAWAVGSTTFGATTSQSVS